MKKSKLPTLALCMIVKSTDEEAILLERALKHVVTYVDSLYLTFTGEPSPKCKEIIDYYTNGYAWSNGEFRVSIYPWDNNFANARNFNFSQSKADYNFWIDCDDVVKQPWVLPEIMAKIAESNGAIDSVIMDYLYDFDPDTKVCTVKHLKTRIVKNDGSMTWVGALHEDFEKHREINALYNPEVEIIHLPPPGKDKERLERNLTIAKENAVSNPNDPRAVFILANTIGAAGELHEANKLYLDFIETSGSEEEIYLAYIRLASNFRELGDSERAKEAALQALKIRPWYPDAYISVGQTFYKESKFQHAETWLLQGVRIAAEDKRYERTMVVWNPRDYDVNPLLLLALTYLNITKPREAKQCLETVLKVVPNHPKAKEMLARLKPEVKKLDEVDKVIEKASKTKDRVKLKKYLDSLPLELKSHPGVCYYRNRNFIKTKSSGRDLAIFCYYTSEEWNPDTAKKTGIGGSEEAIIHLAPRLAKLGWNVTVYANMGYHMKKFDGVTWRPWWEWNFRDKQDVTIVWRHPKTIDYKMNSTVQVVDLHDVHTFPYEWSKDRQRLIDKIFVKSEAHKRVIQLNSGVQIPDEKFIVIPNGIDVNEFPEQPTLGRDPYYLLNTSSPDRSLDTLIDLYLEARERLPEEIKNKVKLGWYYGWNVFDAMYSSDEKKMEWRNKLAAKFQKLVDQGIAEGGYRLPHQEINKLYLKAGALVYPTIFYEIHCISAAKAQAAGAVPITTDFSALRETVQFGMKIDPREPDKLVEGVGHNFGLRSIEARKEWVESLVRYLTSNVSPDYRKEMSDWARGAFDWDRIANKWHEEIKKLLEGKQK